MSSARLCLVGIFAILLAFPVALAQEGHPLTGTWFGDWGPDAGSRNHLTVVLDWDGDDIRGVINPGPDAIPITAVFLDVADWTVRLEAEARDGNDQPVAIRAVGQLQDILSRNRTLAGSWRHGDTEGEFRLTRD